MHADELADLIAVAAEATAGLDDVELRRVAFERVLDYLLAASGPSHPTEPGSATRTPPSMTAVPQGADGTFASEQQRADALAHYFKIDSLDVQHIFDISDQEPQLVVATGRLAPSKAEGTREITLLVAGARTALGQQTESTHIRQTADHFGRYDSANFMTSLGRMPEISLLGKPRSPNRVVRMRATGAEAAQALAQKILSG